MHELHLLPPTALGEEDDSGVALARELKRYAGSDLFRRAVNTLPVHAFWIKSQNFHAVEPFVLKLKVTDVANAFGG